MQSLIRENEELKKVIEGILGEIEEQKQLNQQHEQEIETLLKFNERLLAIIENQTNNKQDQFALHPISERSERESDLIGNAMNSLIKSKRLVARSERGQSPTNSLISPKSPNLVTVNRARKQSEIDHSIEELQQEYRLQQKTAYPALAPRISSSSAKMNDIQKAVQNSSVVRQEMSKQISELKKFRNESMKFYDNKKSELKELSSKLGRYKPMEQLKEISSKLTLSEGTSQMIMRAMQKSQNK